MNKKWTVLNIALNSEFKDQPVKQILHTLNDQTYYYQNTPASVTITQFYEKKNRVGKVQELWTERKSGPSSRQWWVNLGSSGPALSLDCPAG